MIQASDIIRLTGLSYRQVQYWDEKFINVNRKLCKTGSSFYRSFNQNDVLWYCAISELKKQGASLQKIGKVFIPQLTKIFDHPRFGNDSRIMRIKNDLFLINVTDTIYFPKGKSLFHEVLDCSTTLSRLYYE